MGCYESLFHLRRASGDDYRFLYDVTTVTMKEYIAAVWGWDESRHSERFMNSFDVTGWQIIVVDTTDIGGLNLHYQPSELFIANIYILPDYQRRGIGTAIIRTVIAEAESLGVPVTLTVLKVNARARELYERVGFRVVADEDYKYRMSTG